MKKCKDCRRKMSVKQYGNICRNCMDDRVPGEKPFNISSMSDEEYVAKVVRSKGVLKD